MLNQLKLILDELFRIWHWQYHPTQHGWQCADGLSPVHHAKACNLFEMGDKQFVLEHLMDRA